MPTTVLRMDDGAVYPPAGITEMETRGSTRSGDSSCLSHQKSITRSHTYLFLVLSGKVYRLRLPGLRDPIKFNILNWYGRNKLVYFNIISFSH